MARSRGGGDALAETHSSFRSGCFVAPILHVEVNGQPVHVTLDTGSSLGLELFGPTLGRFVITPTVKIRGRAAIEGHMSEVCLIERSPTAAEYRVLRREVGWAEVDERGVNVGLSSTLYSVCAEDPGGEIVGCARVVGDGGIYLYVQDVIVRPRYQGRGIGARLMDRVMDFIAGTARSNMFVGLMAAEGVIEFYRRYGFEPRPDGRPGMYMMWEGIS